MKKSRAYYQYMLDLADNKVSYYSTDDISQVIFDLLDDGDVAEAMSACMKGLDQHPDDEHLELIEAKVLMHLHRWDETERILAKNPDAESPFGIGIRFGIDAQTSDQIQAFDDLMEHLADREITMLEFIEIVNEVFDSLSRDMTAHYLKEVVRITEDDAPSQNEQYAEALARIGAMLMDCNCHRDAIPILEKSLDIDAYDVFSWQDLSRCQFQLQKYADCQNSCEMGLAIDPKNPLFHFILGYILCNDGKEADAIEHLEISRQYAEGKLQHDELHLERLETEQQTNVTYELLSTAYLAVGNNEKALECLTILVHRIPEFSEGYFRLATLELDRGNSTAALSNIEEAIRIDSTNTSYQALRVTMLTDMKRFDEALQGLDKLIELDPKSKTYLLAKAELALNLRHYKEADKAYRALLKLKPKDSTSKELMRNYFEAIGDADALSQIK